MRIVVGLGNPGERYRRTRHNVGFRVADTLAARLSAPPFRDEGGALVAEVRLGAEEGLLVKPQSFMNLSGVPVAGLLAAHEVAARDLVVVVDDAALELGMVRVRGRGSHGGHNGLRSLIDELGTEDFPRVRLGIRAGELPEELAEWVLDDFPKADEPAVGDLVARGADAVECLVAKGVQAAMNRFNARQE